MEHTQGKLRTESFSGRHFVWHVNSKSDGTAVVYDCNEGIARRLVACWNACEGVSTEWLEAQTDPASEELFGKVAPLDKRLQAAMLDAEAAKVQRDALKAQGDELLEALDAFIEYDDYQVGDGMEMMALYADAVALARAAIARVTAPAVEGGA